MSRIEFLPTSEVGGRCLSVDAFGEAHDKISFSIGRGQIKSEKCAALYASGLSTAAIARQLKMSKSSVIWHLRDSGVSLRPSSHAPEGKKASARNYHAGHAPFGYLHLDGQLVMDPKEMSVVHQIVGMWKSGMGTGDIMRKLNSSSTKARHGGVWRY